MLLLARIKKRQHRLGNQNLGAQERKNVKNGGKRLMLMLPKIMTRLHGIYQREKLERTNKREPREKETSDSDWMTGRESRIGGKR